MIYFYKNKIQSIDVLIKDAKHSSITRMVKKNNILSMYVLQKYIQCMNIMHGDNNLDTLSCIKHEMCDRKVKYMNVITYNAWTLQLTYSVWY